MTQIETARQIQQTFQNTVASIRSDPALSAAGKQQKLTEAYQQAATKMASAKQAYAAAVGTERESLQKSVFGLAFKMSATEADKAAAQALYRDALDRTATLRTEQAALDLLETAHLTGDRTLLQAAALTAYRNGWGRALAVYADIEPDAGNRIYELQDLDAAHHDPMHRLGASMAFNLQRPPEVGMNAEYRPAAD